MQKDGQEYFAALEIKNVTVEDAGKYKVTAKNELGESNATITLNFDSKYRTILLTSATSEAKTQKLRWMKTTHTFASFAFITAINNTKPK